MTTSARDSRSQLLKVRSASRSQRTVLLKVSPILERGSTRFRILRLDTKDSPLFERTGRPPFAFFPSFSRVSVRGVRPEAKLFSRSRVLHPKTVTFFFFSLACDPIFLLLRSSLAGRGERFFLFFRYIYAHINFHSFSTVRSFLIPFIRRERESKPIRVNSLALVFRHDYRYLLDRYNALYLCALAIYHSNEEVREYFELVYPSSSLFLHSQVAKKKKKEEVATIDVVSTGASTFLQRGRKKRKRTYYYYLKRGSRTSYIYIYFSACFLFLRILFDIGDETRSREGIVSWNGSSEGGIYT